MPFKLNLPDPLPNDGWKVKIFDGEPDDEEPHVTMNRQIILLDAGKVEWPENVEQLDPHRVSTPAEIDEALAQDENVTWIARDPKQLLNYVEIGHSRKRRDLLLLDPAGRLRVEALRQLFDHIVAPDDDIDLLSDERLFAILGQDHPGDYFIGAGYDADDGLVLLYRGNMEALSVKEKFFEENNVEAPDFENLDIVDWGQTVRLGDYEIGADSILYPRDAEFRRRQKEKRRQLDDSFGGSVRRLRTMRGLSQGDFEGVSAKTIRRIEKGDVENPRATTIETIADALDVEPDDIESY